jgi:hypothetical protein
MKKVKAPRLKRGLKVCGTTTTKNGIKTMTKAKKKQPIRLFEYVGRARQNAVDVIHAAMDGKGAPEVSITLDWDRAPLGCVCLWIEVDGERHQVTITGWWPRIVLPAKVVVGEVAAMDELNNQPGTRQTLLERLRAQVTDLVYLRGEIPSTARIIEVVNAGRPVR